MRAIEFFHFLGRSLQIALPRRLPRMLKKPVCRYPRQAFPKIQLEVIWECQYERASCGQLESAPIDAVTPNFVRADSRLDLAGRSEWRR